MYQFHYFSCRQPSRFPPATAPPELFVARLPVLYHFLDFVLLFPTVKSLLSRLPGVHILGFFRWYFVWGSTGQFQEQQCSWKVPPPPQERSSCLWRTESNMFPRKWDTSWERVHRKLLLCILSGLGVSFVFSLHPWWSVFQGLEF